MGGGSRLARPGNPTVSPATAPAPPVQGVQGCRPPRPRPRTWEPAGVGAQTRFPRYPTALGQLGSHPPRPSPGDDGPREWGREPTPPTGDVHRAHLAWEPRSASRHDLGPGHEGPWGWVRRPTLPAEDFHKPHPTGEYREASPVTAGHGPDDEGPWEWGHGPTSRTEDAHGARPAWEPWDATRPGPGHGFGGPLVWERGPAPPAEDTSGAHPLGEYREAARPDPGLESPRLREASPRAGDVRWVSNPATFFNPCPPTHPLCAANLCHGARPPPRTRPLCLSKRRAHPGVSRK